MSKLCGAGASETAGAFPFFFVGKKKEACVRTAWAVKTSDGRTSGMAWMVWQSLEANEQGWDKKGPCPWTGESGHVFATSPARHMPCAHERVFLVLLSFFFFSFLCSCAGRVFVLTRSSREMRAVLVLVLVALLCVDQSVALKKAFKRIAKVVTKVASGKWLVRVSALELKVLVFFFLQWR